MPKIESYQKQAKLIVRWHKDGNHSIGELVRLLGRFKHLSDDEALAMRLPLTLAQEIVAVEAGFGSWADLKRGANGVAKASALAQGAPRLSPAVPILCVRDVKAAAAFFEKTLGFTIDFLHGAPAFYGAVSRDDACLHLRFVAQPNFAELAAREPSLILATIETSDVKALFAEYEGRGATFAQRLVRKAWGGLDFSVSDPDGNCISFVQYRMPTEAGEDG